MGEKIGLRRFGGRRDYYPRFWYKTRKQAEAEAGRRRKRGYSCRIVSALDGFVIYSPLGPA